MPQPWYWWNSSTTSNEKPRSSVLVFTLLPPLHLLDLVHGALEDVALVRLDAETGNVPNVGGQQLGQLLDVAALQLPSPLLHAAETAKW